MTDQYRSLMARYQAGDRAAFESFYALVAPDVRRQVRVLAPEADTERVLEEVFLQIHRARGSYDPRRPFEPWLQAIVRHVVSARQNHRPRRGMLKELAARFIATSEPEHRMPAGSLLRLR